MNNRRPLRCLLHFCFERVALVVVGRINWESNSAAGRLARGGLQSPRGEEMAASSRVGPGDMRNGELRSLPS